LGVDESDSENSQKESYQKQFIRKIIKVNDWTPANVNSLWKIKTNLLLVKGTEKKFH